MGVIAIQAPAHVMLDAIENKAASPASLSIAEFDVESFDALSRMAQSIAREMQSDGILVAWHDGGDGPQYLFADGGWEGGSSLECEMIEMASHAGDVSKRTPRSQWREVSHAPSTGLLTNSFPADDGIVTVTTLFRQIDQTTRMRAGEAASRTWPLVQPFFSVWIAQARSKSRLDALTEAINRSDVGVLFVNRDGRLTFANDMAETLIERKDGLRRQGGMLAATKLADTLRLQALIEHVVSRQDVSAPAPVVAIHRATGSPLMVTLFPIKAANGGPRDSAAVIYVFDPDKDYRAMLAPICTLYGLSPVEARLACMIANGMSLADAARVTRVRELTARSYLKQVFFKTGTKRQAELVALMLKSAVRTAPTSPTKLV